MLQRLGQSFNSAGVALFAKVALVSWPGAGTQQPLSTWQACYPAPHPLPLPDLRLPAQPACRKTAPLRCHT